MKKEIEIPENIEVRREDKEIVFSHEDREAQIKLTHPLVKVKVKDQKIIIVTEREGKEVKGVLGTFASKINNALKGVQEGFEAKLKILYRHFPMNIEVNNNTLKVTNFLGEKNPRKVEIIEGTNIEIDDEEIKVEGTDKERVGQTAARIEQEIQAPNKKDRRVFSDGIYIVEKAN